MKDVNKLVRLGWSKAMIHQRTLSLILTLDNFLISGPHILQDDKYDKAMSDPNVFFVNNKSERSYIESELDKEENKSVLTTTHTYYIMRSFIRGILFGLNPLYQISLFVPCSNPKEIKLYEEIISRIDIGRQFFEDRIYWNLESLKHDIMDSRLACLIYADNSPLVHSEWSRQISIETKPFIATFDSDSRINVNLSDLVEMRTFLEDMHQKYFSLITEYKKTHFVEMIRSHLSHGGKNPNYHQNAFNVSGYYSVKTDLISPNFKRKKFIGDRLSMKEKVKLRNGLDVFKKPLPIVEPWKNIQNNTKLLFEEYERIIHEQGKVNFQMSRNDLDSESFKKLLGNWNSMTLKKSEVLKDLLNSKDSRLIKEKLSKMNAYCYQIRYQEDIMESGVFQSSQSPNSSLSEISDSEYMACLPISQHHETVRALQNEIDTNLNQSWFV